MKREDMIRQIAVNYGLGRQSEKLIEELSELIIAVKNQQEVYDYPIDWDKAEGTMKSVEEEIADSLIMIWQMIFLYDCADGVNAFIDSKLDRQMKRIGEEKKDENT